MATTDIYQLVFDIVGKGAAGLNNTTNSVATAQGKLATNTTNANTAIAAQTPKADAVAKKTGPASSAAGKFANNAGLMASKASLAAKGISGMISPLGNLLGIDTSQLESALLLFASMPTSLSKTLKGIGGGVNALAKNLGIISNNGSGAATALGNLGGASKGLLITLGPILVVIIVIGAILALVQTNAFGFRDALNAVGKAVGDALPFLRPFLELIKSIFSALLGITGEGALDIGAAFEGITTQFTTGLQSIQKAVDAFVLDPIGFITNFFTNIGKWFADNPAYIAGAMLGPIGLAIVAVDQYLGGPIEKFATNFLGTAAKFMMETIPSWFATVFSASNLVSGINGVAKAIQSAIIAFFNIFAGPKEVAAGAVKFFLNFTAGIKGAIAGGIKIIISTFAGFWKVITDTATTTGKNIPKLIWDAIKAAASTLTSAGKWLWEKLAGGLLSVIPENIFGYNLRSAAKKALGLAQGGLINSAASGKVFTTRGPTLTLAGDNNGGKETVAYIPHNNPTPTLRAIAKMFGLGGTNTAVVATGGGGTMHATFIIKLGTKELIKEFDFALGNNFKGYMP